MRFWIRVCRFLRVAGVWVEKGLVEHTDDLNTCVVSTIHGPQQGPQRNRVGKHPLPTGNAARSKNPQQISLSTRTASRKHTKVPCIEIVRPERIPDGERILDAERILEAYDFKSYASRTHLTQIEIISGKYNFNRQRIYTHILKLVYSYLRNHFPLDLFLSV